MFRFIKRLFGDTRTQAPVSKSSNSEPIKNEPEFEIADANRAPAATVNVTASVPHVATPIATHPSPANQACVEIPLLPVFDRLAPALRVDVGRAPSRADVIKLPISTVVDQLPHGAVRIPFRELKHGVTPGIFPPGRASDETLVEVPLAEVLPRLGSSYLARRPEQKKVAEPEAVPAVFTARAVSAAPPVPPTPNTAAVPSKSTPAQPTPAAQASKTVAKPKSVPGHQDDLASSRAIASTNPSIPPTRPTSQSQPAKPATPLAPRPAQAPRAEPPSSNPEPVPAIISAEGLPTPATGPASVQEPVKAPLAAIARNWPEAMRREIMASHLAAIVQIPYTELEAAMKRGKATFTWKQLRMWASPRPITAMVEHDEAVLELPLPVLTPLFLARLSGPEKAKPVPAGGEIPDVFAARKPVDPSGPVAPAIKSEPASGATAKHDAQPSQQPKPGATPAAPAVRGPALPGDLVQRACLLSGVVGAIMATPDGLVIASHLPASMSAELMAGILPQIHTRLAQYTRELQLGEPSQLEMLVGSGPMMIFKASGAYLAVLGKPSETLPRAQLVALAAQLSHRTN